MLMAAFLGEAIDHRNNFLTTFKREVQKSTKRFLFIKHKKSDDQLRAFPSDFFIFILNRII